MVQHLFPHRLQLFAHGGPVGPFQQVTQEVVREKVLNHAALTVSLHGLSLIHI